jgi:hypothetical protein
MGHIRESWSEAQVLALPDGEHNFFDRKSGKMWLDRGKLNATLAKALSAFANSGGGHLILGQQDDGALDGVPEQEGRTPVREWLEQKIPTLVAYPLESFRVHLVTLGTPSQVPNGKSLIVIDVGDSRLAPHQAAIPSDAPHYYYRQGGKSVLAPHHYLEALRNRLTFAVVEPRLKNIKVVNSLADEGGKYIVETILIFEVKNVSRVACYKWTISLSLKCSDEEENILRQCVVDKESFPRLGSGRMEIPGDPTILPTQSRDKHFLLGLRLDSTQSIPDQVARFLSWEANYSAISEAYLGTERQTKLSDVVELDALTAAVNQSLADYKQT